MWELLGSFSQTPILLLGRKEQNRINRGRRDNHLEECSSHVNNNGTWKKRNYFPKSKKIRKPKIELATKDVFTDPPIHISDELLTALKKMSPQDLKNTLIQPEEEQEEVDLTDMEEYDLTGSGEPVYETPIMTPQLTRRIMANEFSPDQVEYILKKALQN